MAVACTTTPNASGERNRGTPTGLSTAEYLETMGRDLAYVLGVPDPPAVAVVRWVLPEEVEDLVNACMREQGFAVLQDGTREAPPEQQAALRLADYTCTMKYPPKMEYVGPLRGEQIDAQYDWTVKFLVPCLRGFGIEVVDVPSRAKFVADWPTSPFRPYEQVASSNVGAAKFAAIEKACPQNGPSEVVRGGGSLESWLQDNPIPSPSAEAS